MLILSNATPKTDALPGAAESLGRREVTGTRLGSADLERLPGSWRRRAFFSAKVENERFLELAKAQLRRRVEQFGANRDRATFVANLQEAARDLGLTEAVDPALRGTLQDISSRRRLELIFDIQSGLALGEAAYLSGLDPDVYNAAPAQELVRVSARVEPRDWPERWRAAGGAFTAEGRMIALKDDRIWRDISRFGLPWPPFDFQSGMGVRDVRRREAVALGLVRRGERLTPPPAESLLEDAAPAASIDGLGDAAAGRLQESFGDLATLDRTGRTLALDPTAVSRWIDSAPAPDETLSLGDAPAAGTGRSVAMAGRDLPELTAGDDAPQGREWDDLPAVLWMPDEVSRETDEETGSEAITFAARLGRTLWRAAVTWEIDSLVGRLARFWKLP